MSMFRGEDQFDTALLLTMREDLQDLKTQTDQRFAELETIIKSLADDVKKLVVLRPADSVRGPESDTRVPAKSFAEVEIETDGVADVEDISSNWNYIIVKKGGYNNLLHITVQELLELDEDGVNFLGYLAQRRTIEIQHRLQQLQAEYQRLQGNQLQEHFQELWRSHYILLKNKRSRTWKEEIFLAAFDAFISWIQT